MPAVANPVADVPVKLERIEVEPGVVLKLSAKDADAYKARKAAEAKTAAAYAALVSGAGQPEIESPAAPAEVPLTILSKAELVTLAEARGLSAKGTKAEIAARFAEGARADESAPAPETEPVSDGGAAGGAPAGAAPDAVPADE